MHFDVIIIGSGISGLNFALRAAQEKKKTLIVTKKEIAEAGTNFAQGGIAAVLSKVDNFDKHVSDTLVAGSYHNDEKAVNYMVKHGPDAIRRLIEFGVPFATHLDKLLLTREGGHSERRIAFVSDYTGQAIEKALVEKVKNNPFISLYEHTFAAELLVKEGICYGVQIINNESKNIFANIIVLATGGIGQLFEHTTNPEISTGDGLGMAARAGCKFKDLEFVQFHPTALNLKGKPKFLISEAVRGEGAHLLNSKGKRFMIGKHKLAELAPRDIVSRAIYEEEKEGSVFLDLRHKTKDYLETRFPQIYLKLKDYGIKMEKDLIPISPAAHYMCGGIKVNLRGETGVKNLFAFGEVTCTGVHGANRLASNSLLEALVFSNGILAGTKAKIGNLPKFSPLKTQKISTVEKKSIIQIRKELKKTMWKNVGIVRNEQGLTTAVNELNRLRKTLNEIKKIAIETIETKNMIEASLLIAKAALKNRKSIGCHFRND